MRSARCTVIALTALAACTTKEARRSDTTAPATATLAGAPAADVAAIGKAIEAAEALQAAALIKGDTLAAAAFYADDAIVLPPNDKLAKGREAITKAMANMLAVAKITAFTPHREDLIVSGDYAIETSTFEMTLQPKTGKPVQDKGKFLTVFKKQSDGSYKAIRDIINSDLPAK